MFRLFFKNIIFILYIPLFIHSLKYSTRLLMKTDTNIKTDIENPSQIYVCTNKWCRDKGSDATMAAFTFLTPEVIL